MITMRYRVAMYLMNPQNTVNNDAPIAGETPLFNVGSYEATNPTSVVITSLSRAVSAIQSINNRIQSALLTNVRFEVFGKPVGTPEPGAPPLTGALLDEKRYIMGDTPQPALLVALRLANRKPVDPNAGAAGIKFVPTDTEPEVKTFLQQ